MTETQPRDFFSKLKGLITSFIPPSYPTAEEAWCEAQREVLEEQREKLYASLARTPSPVSKLKTDGTLVKPEGVSDDQFNGAATSLQTFFESQAVGKNPQRTERLRKKVLSKIDQGILPPTAIAFLGYEKET